MKRHVSVREGYDAWAAVYDSDGNPLTALDDEVVPSMLPDVRDKDVLDLGCGTGRHTARLAAQGARVVGVDVSRGMIDKARAKCPPSVRFVVREPGAPLPVDARAFDVVICTLVLEHVADLQAAFAEMRNALRPGGVAVVTEMHPAFRAISQANFTDPATGDDVLPTSHRHAVDDYGRAARDAGFTVDAQQEHAGTDALAQRWPRAARYVGMPMLLALKLTA